MKLSKSLFYSIVLFSVFSGTAFAGVGSGGGADSVVCRDNFGLLADYSYGPYVRTLPDGSNVVLVYENVLHSALEGEFLLHSLDNSFDSGRTFAQEDVRNLIIDMVAESNPNEAGLIQKALSELTFSYVNKIPKLNTGLIVESPGCKRVQDAVQDFDTGIVSLIDYSKLTGVYLDNSQEALVTFPILQIHEAFVRVGHHRGLDLPANETYTRGRLGQIITSKEFGQRLFQKIFSDSRVKTNFAFAVAEIRSSYPGNSATFLSSIEALQFPCHFNETAFNALDFYPARNRLSLPSINFDDPNSQQDEVDAFTKVCK
jgi:hypothetical protein